MENPKLDTPAMRHFLRLVAAGHRRGCSRAEGAAHELANGIAEHIPGFDLHATAGLVQWIAFCQQFPSTARDVLRTVTTAG